MDWLNEKIPTRLEVTWRNLRLNTLLHFPHDLLFEDPYGAEKDSVDHMGTIAVATFTTNFRRNFCFKSYIPQDLSYIEDATRFLTSKDY